MLLQNFHKKACSGLLLINGSLVYIHALPSYILFSLVICIKFGETGFLVTHCTLLFKKIKLNIARLNFYKITAKLKGLK